MLQDKFHLTLPQNLFLAKKLLVESVYCSIKVEGLNTTFPETQTILDGVNVGSVTLSDITTILNLRDAWRFALGTVSQEIDLATICKINEFVSRNESLEWGVLRTGVVHISGTDYVPPVPEKESILAGLNEILNSKATMTERALRLFCFLARSQLFWDGNKRTATLAANWLMIQRGVGLLQIKEKCLSEFNLALKKFYDTGDSEELIYLLYENCVVGMTV